MIDSNHSEDIVGTDLERCWCLGIPFLSSREMTAEESERLDRLNRRMIDYVVYGSLVFGVSLFGYQQVQGIVQGAIAPVMILSFLLTIYAAYSWFYVTKCVTIRRIDIYEGRMLPIWQDDQLLSGHLIRYGVTPGRREKIHVAAGGNLLFSVNDRDVHMIKPVVFRVDFLFPTVVWPMSVNMPKRTKNKDSLRLIEAERRELAQFVQRWWVRCIITLLFALALFLLVYENPQLYWTPRPDIERRWLYAIVPGMMSLFLFRLSVFQGIQAAKLTLDYFDGQLIHRTPQSSYRLRHSQLVWATPSNPAGWRVSCWFRWVPTSSKRPYS